MLNLRFCVLLKGYLAYPPAESIADHGHSRGPFSLRITTPSNVELKCYVPLAEPEEAEEANRYRKGVLWEASIQPTHHLGSV